ncbi:MAG: DUF1285 domain-containing protein [Rhizomicrobium sp.]
MAPGSPGYARGTQGTGAGLFSTILRKDGDDYVLVTPAEKMRIRVDDAPFTAVLMYVEGKGRGQTLTFVTNVGDELMAGPGDPIRVETDPVSGEPAPYVHVRRGLKRASRVRCSISSPIWRCRAKTAMRGCLACGVAACFFPIGRAP